MIYMKFDCCLIYGGGFWVSCASDKVEQMILPAYTNEPSSWFWKYETQNRVFKFLFVSNNFDDYY